MIEILQFTFQSFWHFVGMLFLIYFPFKLIVFLVNRPLRHRNIMKHGWPPHHCDADGDFKEEKQ